MDIIGDAAEVSRTVRAVITNLVCGRCKSELYRTNEPRQEYPPYIEYECPTCGGTTRSVTEYPVIDEIGGDDA